MSSKSVLINEELRPVSSGVLSAEEKDRSYGRIFTMLDAEISMMEDVVSRMASICSLLKSGLPYYFWVGFYLVHPQHQDELIIGPYQGTYACTHIAMNRGVCGRCATIKQTIVVPDVDDCQYHIACDSKSRSEIVVPVFHEGALYGVLDVDSAYLSAFDDTDVRWLEKIVGTAF